jgi:hypothetical protein
VKTQAVVFRTPQFKDAPPTAPVAAKEVPVAAPMFGVVSAMFVAVAPLGSARTPVALVLIVAEPLLEPFSTTLPPVPLLAPSVIELVPVKVVNAPDPGVVPPIAPGAANVALPRVAALTLVRDAPLIAGKLPVSFVASIEVTAEIVPGAINVLGVEHVTPGLPLQVI